MSKPDEQTGNDAPPVPAPDDKDWTWVLHQACPECTFDATAVDPKRTGELIRETIPDWQRVLTGARVTVRPVADVWSPLEYGCHVLDVCELFDTRLIAMLEADGAVFDNWDQDATALQKQYWTADPAAVSADYAVAARRLADRFDGVDENRWGNRGVRSNGSEFTVATFAGYLLHDLYHHLHDVGAR